LIHTLGATGGTFFNWRALSPVPPVFMTAVQEGDSFSRNQDSFSRSQDGPSRLPYKLVGNNIFD